MPDASVTRTIDISDSGCKKYRMRVYGMSGYHTWQPQTFRNFYGFTVLHKWEFERDDNLTPRACITGTLKVARADKLQPINNSWMPSYRTIDETCWSGLLWRGIEYGTNRNECICWRPQLMLTGVANHCATPTAGSVRETADLFTLITIWRATRAAQWHVTDHPTP